jgi:hypothetical protein
MAIMANPSTLATQSTAARIAGWTLLLLMVSGLAGMLAFGVSPIVDGDAVATAQNMLMHERAFRGSLTCEIVMLNCDMVLALALYLFSNPKYMSLMDGRQSHALASIFFDLHKRLSIMGLMFFCFGAGIHSWLLYKSRYIPRIISALYLFACVEMLLCFFLFILFPRTRDVLDPAFIVPDALAELSAALWLALKGADLPVSTNIEPSLCDPSET